MPVYIYKREDGTKFETLQGINDDPLEECPETGQPCKRVITGGIGTVFRGGDWPDKNARREKELKKNPYKTTLPEYEERIKENSEKARELKELARQGKSPTGKIS